MAHAHAQAPPSNTLRKHRGNAHDSPRHTAQNNANDIDAIAGAR